MSPSDRHGESKSSTVDRTAGSNRGVDMFSDNAAASVIHFGKAGAHSSPDSSPGDGTIPSGAVDDTGRDGGWRAAAGEFMHTVSDAINENIIIARYGTMATITLLAGYGIYRTPLFFRFRTVSDIPPDHFMRRRTIHGRIVQVTEGDSSGIGQAWDASKEAERPVTCLVRHLSPIGRLQSRAAFDFSAENSPSARLAGKLEMSRDLLKIEIAGVKLEPQYRNAEDPEGQWLRRLAAERTLVTCQLLSRRIVQTQVKSDEGTESSTAAKPDAFIDPDSEQFAVCRLNYRPPRSLFRQDVALALVRNGRANVASGIHTDDPARPTVDGSTRVDDLRKDAEYLGSLEKVEFEAVKRRLGMWNDDLVRKAHSDLVEEAEFEVTASAAQRLWRWIRGRAGF